MQASTLASAIILSGSSVLLTKRRLETIPVVAERFLSRDYSDAVQEVIDSINFLTGGGSKHAFDFDAMPDDALAVYYGDFVLQRLVADGAQEFLVTAFPLHTSTIRDVDRALGRINAENHRTLFRSIVADAERNAVDVRRYDVALQDLQQAEALQRLIDTLLRTSAVFRPMSETEFNHKIAELLAAEIFGKTTN